MVIPISHKPAFGFQLTATPLNLECHRHSTRAVASLQVARDVFVGLFFIELLLLGPDERAGSWKLERWDRYLWSELRIELTRSVPFHCVRSPRCFALPSIFLGIVPHHFNSQSACLGCGFRPNTIPIVARMYNVYNGLPTAR